MIPAGRIFLLAIFLLTAERNTKRFMMQQKIFLAIIIPLSILYCFLIEIFAELKILTAFFSPFPPMVLFIKSLYLKRKVSSNDFY